MRTKRNLSVPGTALLLALALVLAGCGRAEPPGSSAGGTERPEIPSDDAGGDSLAGTVWLGRREDVMYEYRLEVADADTIFLLEMLEGSVVRIQEGVYAFDGRSIRIDGIPMIGQASYEPEANAVSVRLSGSGLLFIFRPADEPVLSDATLQALLDSSG